MSRSKDGTLRLTEICQLSSSAKTENSGPPHCAVTIQVPSQKQGFADFISRDLAHGRLRGRNRPRQPNTIFAFTAQGSTPHSWVVNHGRMDALYIVCFRCKSHFPARQGVGLDRVQVRRLFASLPWACLCLLMRCPLYRLGSCATLLEK